MYSKAINDQKVLKLLNFVQLEKLTATTTVVTSMKKIKTKKVWRGKQSNRFRKLISFEFLMIPNQRSRTFSNYFHHTLLNVKSTSSLYEYFKIVNIYLCMDEITKQKPNTTPENVTTMCTCTTYV